MSNDNGGIPPQGQQPPAYPGAPVPPQATPGPVPPQPTFVPGAAPQQPPYATGGAPQQPPAPFSPGAAAPAHGYPATPGYPGTTPAASGYPIGPYATPYTAPLKSNGLAVTSMILGIASVLLFWLYLLLPLGLGIAAVITGHISLKRIGKDRWLGGKGMTIAGLITGYAGIVFSVIIGGIMIAAIIYAINVSGYRS